MTKRSAEFSESEEEDEAVDFLGGKYHSSVQAGRDYYRRILFQGEEYQLGDCIQLRFIDESVDRFEIGEAEIIHFWECSQDSDLAKGMEVRWFYRRGEKGTPKPPPPLELAGGEGIAWKSIALSHELFCSNNVSDSPISAIVGKITVLDPRSFVEQAMSKGVTTGLNGCYVCSRILSLSNQRFLEIDFSGSSSERRERSLRHSTHHTQEPLITQKKPPSSTPTAKTATLGSKFQLSSPITRFHLSNDTTPKRRRKDQPLLDAYSRAISNLQLSAAPRFLPCREKERKEIYDWMETALTGKQGGPIFYISGMPGTGKTATVRDVAASLQDQADSGAVPGFDYVEVNAMRFTSPADVYVEVEAALSHSNRRVSHAEAQKRLEARFSGKKKTGGKMCVLMVDELDYLVAPKQLVLYNLFDWPHRPNSRLVLIGISNTMDLPDRLGQKLKSRLGSNQKMFKSYTREQVAEIVKSRLADSNDVFDAGAIEFTARKVAAYSGDVRQALQLCCRAAERRRGFLLDKNIQTSSKSVTIEDINHAHKELNDSPLIQALKAATPLEALVLVAIGQELRYSGREEARMDSIYVKVRDLVPFLAIPRYKSEIFYEHVSEICQRLRDVSIIQMHEVPGDRVPLVTLSVRDDLLAESLATH